MAKRAAAQTMQDRLSRSFQRIPADDVPRIFRLRLSEIEPNPDQPRKHVDQESLGELAASIERHGLIQPITVKRRDDGREGYVLVAGERRFRAHKMLKRTEILAIVTVGAADEISLIENIQRQDLRPLEEAAAYARMMQAHGWTQEQLAEAVGKARPTITNILKLNGLPESIRSECERQPDISKSLLFEIARQDGWKAQEQLWAKVRADGTVRQARVAATKLGDSTVATATSRRPKALLDLASSSQRFLKQLEEAEKRGVEDDILEEIRSVRQGLEGLLGRLKRRGKGKRST